MSAGHRTLSPDVERDVILKAAYGLIGRRPDSTVSVHDILEAAHLSTRAFYRHFQSKDELILTMYRTAAGRYADELVGIVASTPGILEAFEACIRHELALVYDPRRVRQVRVLTSHEARAASGFARVEQESGSVRLEVFADLIRRGIEAGVFPKATDVELDARAVLGVLGGIVEAHLAGATVPTWEQATVHTTGLFLRAFGVTAGS